MGETSAVSHVLAEEGEIRRRSRTKGAMPALKSHRPQPVFVAEIKQTLFCVLQMKRAKQKPPFLHDMNFSILFDKTAEDK